MWRSNCLRERLTSRRLFGDWSRCPQTPLPYYSDISFSLSNVTNARASLWTKLIVCSDANSPIESELHHSTHEIQKPLRGSAQKTSWTANKETLELNKWRSDPVGRTVLLPKHKIDIQSRRQAAPLQINVLFCRLPRKKDNSISRTNARTNMSRHLSIHGFRGVRYSASLPSRALLVWWGQNAPQYIKAFIN